MGNTGAQRAIVKPRPPIQVIVMRVVTRCTTREGFIGAFQQFCTATTCFIPSSTMRTPGIETGFSIRLADGTPMLRGLCVIREAWPTADNPYQRPGVLIGIRQLTPESKPVFASLLAAAADAAADQARVTEQMPPLFPEPAPRATSVLPANPLTEMDDATLGAFVDCAVYEDDDRDTTRPLAAVGAPTSLPDEVTAPIGDPVPLPPVLPPVLASAPTHEVDDAPTAQMRTALPTLLGVAPVAAVPVAIVATPAAPSFVRARRGWWRRALDGLRLLATRIRWRARSHRTKKQRIKMRQLTRHS